MATYPASAKSFTTKNAGDTIQPADVNDLQAEVTAIETDLLTPFPQARGGTGKDTSGATDGQVLIGKTSDHTLNLATITAGAGISVTNGAGSISIAATGANQLTLLKANSGTDTTSGATTVDTIALASGLTAKDRLMVVVTMHSAAQATAEPLLLNTTDSVTIATHLSNNAVIGADTMAQCVVWISQGQLANTQVQSSYTAMTAAAATTDTTGNIRGLTATFTTAWTGAWTLGLRHTGVTGGGTFRWSWAVFKIAGQ